MVINLRKLLRLPVYTESGKKLGKVFDLELDIDSHVVVRYLVRLNIFSIKNLLIQSSLVKAIKEDRIIVEDSVEKISSVETSSGMVLEE